jgi:hypothetical protein
VRAESLGDGSIGVRSAAPASMRRAVCTSAAEIVINVDSRNDNWLEIWRLFDNFVGAQVEGGAPA